MKNSPKTLAKHLVRLEKQIAQLGLASRREAKSLISGGFVTVNGETTTNPGHGIHPTRDKISIKEDPKNKKEYILLYKPVGIETNKTTSHLKDIHEMYPQFAHLSPIGRLDTASGGLIILSNDGTLTKVLTAVNSKIGKTYLVEIKEKVKQSNLSEMEDGIMLHGIKTKPCKTKKVSENQFEIILHEGRKHQIRQMCDAVKWTVASLTRIAIGNIKIEKLKPGAFVKLTQKEIEVLKKTR